MDKTLNHKQCILIANWLPLCYSWWEEIWSEISQYAFLVKLEQNAALSIKLRQEKKRDKISRCAWISFFLLHNWLKLIMNSYLILNSNFSVTNFQRFLYLWKLKNCVFEIIVLSSLKIQIVNNQFWILNLTKKISWIFFSVFWRAANWVFLVK